MNRFVLAVALSALVLVAPQAGAISYTWGGPPVAIPDNTGVVAIASLNVTDDFSITDLDVEINITHTWVGDLAIGLEAPGGEFVTLVNRLGVPETGLGHSTDNYTNTPFDDDAARGINSATEAEAPFTGSWRPEPGLSTDLSVFNGTSTQGTWNLWVQDWAGGDTGTIDSFTLYVNHDDPSQPVPEPKTLALFGLGLIGLVPIARKSLMG